MEKKREVFTWQIITIISLKLNTKPSTISVKSEISSIFNLLLDHDKLLCFKL